jgi:hypothetical protein
MFRVKAADGLLLFTILDVPILVDARLLSTAKFLGDITAT